jgi:hypothetical protein
MLAKIEELNSAAEAAGVRPVARISPCDHPLPASLKRGRWRRMTARWSRRWY